MRATQLVAANLPEGQTFGAFTGDKWPETHGNVR